MAALPVHDRVGLGGGRMLLKSRMARVFFVIYGFMLHVFLAGAPTRPLLSST